MTKFFWIDTKVLAAQDAADKGITSWAWFSSAAELSQKDPLKFAAVYFKTGINDLEKAFAEIMRRNVPKWLC